MAATTSSRSASSWRCGRGRGRSTSSSTPSRSCTASAGTAASSARAHCRSCSTCSGMITGVVDDPARGRRPDPDPQVGARPVRLRQHALLADRARARASSSWPRSTTSRCRCGTPGASTCRGRLFTVFCWVFGSALLRWVLVGTAKGSTSIYGPLAAPIAVLLWLYLLSIAVLIGAALNAALRPDLAAEGADQRAARADEAAQARERPALAPVAGARPPSTTGRPRPTTRPPTPHPADG